MDGFSTTEGSTMNALMQGGFCLALGWLATTPQADDFQWKASTPKTDRAGPVVSFQQRSSNAAGSHSVMGMPSVMLGQPVPLDLSNPGPIGSTSFRYTPGTTAPVI